MGFESGHTTVYIILYFCQDFFFVGTISASTTKKKLTGNFTLQSQLTSFAANDYFSIQLDVNTQKPNGNNISSEGQIILPMVINMSFSKKKLSGTIRKIILKRLIT